VKGRTTIGVVILVVALGLVACGPRTAGPEAGSSALREGDSAPDFELPAAGGGSVSLVDLRKRASVLLYFSMGPG
jgi:hypothetical protein